MRMATELTAEDAFQTMDYRSAEASFLLFARALTVTHLRRR
jgi:hypothetical protein